MIDAELALASSAGAEPAGAAAREDVGRESKAPAAPDSPGSQAAQAAGAAAAAVAVALGQRGRWAEAALPGSMPRGPGAHADEDAAPLSLEGQPSSSNAYTGHADTGGSPPVATFTSAAERSTAHGAPQDGGVWDTRDGIGSKVQTSSAQTAQSKPCSVTVAGTAAVGSSAGQLASHKAGRQPAETGNTEREVSTSARAACAEKPQAAHEWSKSRRSPGVQLWPSHSVPHAIPHGHAALQGVSLGLFKLHAGWQAQQYSCKFRAPASQLCMLGH